MVYVYKLRDRELTIQTIPRGSWRFGRFVTSETLPEQQNGLAVYFLGPISLVWTRSFDFPSSTLSAPALGKTSLLATVQMLDETSILYLISQEADLNARDERGVPILMGAILQENVSAVRALLQAGANPNLAIEKSRITALMWAVGLRSTEICQLLLEYGADTNVMETHSSARTPLHWAWEGKDINPQIISLLIRYGADINQPNWAGETCLLLAAKHGMEEIVKASIAKGADPNVRAQNGMTALGWAIKKRHKAIQQLLLEEKGIE